MPFREYDAVASSDSPWDDPYDDTMWPFNDDQPCRTYPYDKGQAGQYICSSRAPLLGLSIQFLKRNSTRITLAILIVQLLYIFVKLNTLASKQVDKDQAPRDFAYSYIYEDVAAPRVAGRMLDAQGLGDKNRPDFVVHYEEDYDHLEEDIPAKQPKEPDKPPEVKVKEEPKPALVLAPLKIKPPPEKVVPQTPKPPRPQMPLCTMKERVQHLRNYCNNTDIGDKRPEFYRKARYGGLIVDEKHKLIFCDVSQMASVMWTTVLAKATGAVVAEKPPVRNKKYMSKIGLNYLDTYSNQDRETILSEFFKFLIVQHPFDRLVAQWRLRFVDVPENDPWRRKLGRQIILAKRKLNNRTLTLDELPVDWTAKFDEVVESCFVDRNMIDPTWFTYVQVCHPCEIEYDAVLRVETLKQDTNVILSRLKDYYDGMPDDIPVPAELNVLHGQNNIKSFQNVSLTAHKVLLEKYRHDIGLFGYVWDEAHNNATCSIKSANGDVCC